MQPSRTRLLLPSALALFALAVLCMFTIDQPVARFVAGHDTSPGLWNTGIGILEYLDGIEPSGWCGIYVLCALSAAALAYRKDLAPPVLFITLAHLLGRNVMHWGKFVTGRLRPYEWHGGAQWLAGGSSFPSGHVMLIASIALPLGIVWPRARPATAFAIAFAMIARVMVDAHWVSDVLGGLGATCLVTWLAARMLATWPAPQASPR